MNYTLQLDLGDGFNKADETLDRLLDKISKIGNLDNLKMDRDIDKSGFLKSGESMGETLADGVEKGIKKKKNLIGNWLGLTGEFGVAVQKAQKDFSRPLDKFWNEAIKRGAKGLPEQPIQGPDLSGDLRRKFNSIKPPKGMDENSGTNLNKVKSLPDIGKISEDEAKAKKLDLKKIFTGLLLGGSNPYIGARVLSDELGKKIPAANSGGGFTSGLFGKGGIAGFSEIFLAFKAGKFAFDLLIKSIKATIAAYENARLIYSKALQNGMGLNFSVKRSTLAQIMGVSDQDIFRFGAQVAYLNPRIEMASKILAETAKPLTGVSWQFKILENDLSALFAKLASDAAPAISNFIVGLDKMVQFMIKSVNTIENLWIATNPVIYLAFKLFQKKYDEADLSKMPSPQSWMKQLPASSWEKMGLQIAGGSTNYARETAKNTHATVVALNEIVKGKIFNGPAIGIGGMNPYGNNP